MATTMVSDVIRQRLNDTDVSTNQIAKELGLEWKTVNNFANGGNIRSDHLDKLAEYFGLVLTESKKPKGK